MLRGIHKDDYLFGGKDGVAQIVQANDKRMTRREFVKTAGVGLFATGLILPMLEACTPEQVRQLVTSLTQLAVAINNYRSVKGLAQIPISSSLTAVALAHVLDLISYKPQNNCPPLGSSPNLHSWSDHGNWQGVYGNSAWKGCCYDPNSDPGKHCMWDKPKEIANYPTEGFEIAAAGVSTPQDAVNIWMADQPHNAVMLNQDIWANFQWKALGAFVGGGYACAWFGVTQA